MVMDPEKLDLLLSILEDEPEEFCTMWDMYAGEHPSIERMAEMPDSDFYNELPRVSNLVGSNTHRGIEVVKREGVTYIHLVVERKIRGNLDEFHKRLVRALMYITDGFILQVTKDTTRDFEHLASLHWEYRYLRDYGQTYELEYEVRRPCAVAAAFGTDEGPLESVEILEIIYL